MAAAGIGASSSQKAALFRPFRVLVPGEDFGIRFALALPKREAWIGDFMMQGGGGGNGVISGDTHGAFQSGRPKVDPGGMQPGSP